MGEIVERGHRHLEMSDLNTIAPYLKSLPPTKNVVKAKAAK
jgi:hypothetical protein